MNMIHHNQYEMKDSGIEWIGEMPVGWTVSAIKRHYSITLGKMLESIPQTEDATLENYMCASNIKWDGIDTTTNRQMWFSSEEKDEYYLKDGDLLVMEGGSAGTSAIYHGEFTPCYMQNSVNRCRSKDGSLTQFLYYWMFLVYHSGHVESVCNRATIMHLTKEKLGRLPFVQVPLPEQAAIAAYLDEKCATIDALIVEAKATIEEYKKWKASVIFEAVTKGLDPNAEMKDSGIEWIGKVSVNTTVIELKYLIQGYKAGPFGSSLITGELLPEGSILVYTPEHIAKKTIFMDKNLYLPIERKEEMSQFFVKQGDIIFPIVGSLGRAMQITNEMPSGIINQRLAKFRLKEGIVDNAYFMWLFANSSFYSTYIDLYQRGSIIVNLTKTIVGEMPFLLPDLPTQRKIASYLDEKCSAIDAIIAEKEALIGELESYKKSLIFETVTGKRRVC